MFPNAKAAIAASTESNIFKILPFANQVGKFFLVNSLPVMPAKNVKVNLI